MSYNPVKEEYFEETKENDEGGEGGLFLKGRRFRERWRFRDFTIPFGKVITRL